MNRNEAIEQLRQAILQSRLMKRGDWSAETTAPNL